MSTTTQFFNSNNKLITEQQANQLNSFSKNIYIDGFLKKEEDYRENILKGGVYYLSPSENVTAVLNDIGIGLNWAIKSNKQIINGYTIWEIRWYDNNLQTKSEYAKEVRDSSENPIATVTFDTITNQTKGAYKVFYYGNQQLPDGDPGDLFPDDSWIGFSFSDDGTIQNITMMYNMFNNEGYWTKLSRFLEDTGDFLQEIGMTPEKLNYFTNVNPVVPNF